MKEYVIQFSCEVRAHGDLSVEAKNLDDAIEQAKVTLLGEDNVDQYIDHVDYFPQDTCLSHVEYQDVSDQYVSEDLSMDIPNSIFRLAHLPQPRAHIVLQGLRLLQLAQPCEHTSELIKELEDQFMHIEGKVP